MNQIFKTPEESAQIVAKVNREQLLRAINHMHFQYGKLVDKFLEIYELYDKTKSDPVTNKELLVDDQIAKLYSTCLEQRATIKRVYKLITNQRLVEEDLDG